MAESLSSNNVQCFCLRRKEAGQLVAQIIDPINDTVTPVHCCNAGLLYARSLRRMATAGMVIAHVAGAEAYRSGYLLSP